MKKILLTIFALNTFYTLGTSQIQFLRAIGGANTDVANSIIQTTDGGYAVAGYTSSFGAGGVDMYIVKLNSSGAIQWTRTVGGTSNELAYSIIQTTDGGYAVAGYTSSFGAGYEDMYIVKLDGSGTIQWTRTAGRTGFNDYAYSIIRTGGVAEYLVAGESFNNTTSYYDSYMIGLNSSGTVLFSAIGNETIDDGIHSLFQPSTGGIVAAGYRGYDMFIVSFDGSLTFQWSKAIGGTTTEDAQSIIETTDGGYAFAGYTNSFGAGNYDMCITKINSSGTLQWSKTIGGTNSDYAYSIVRTTDGGFAVAGFTNSFGAGNYDMYIVRLNSSGTLQWSRTIGGTGNDYALSIVRTTDGGFAVAGYTNSFGAGGSDMYIVKLDANGNTCGNTTSPSSTVTTPSMSTNSRSPFVSITSTVTSPTPTSNSGGTLASICTFVGIQPISNETPASYQLYQNYPNPFNNNSKIKMQISKLGDVKLVIYDALGEEVESLVNEELNPGTYEVEWDASNYPSGIYFYTLTAGYYKETRKMVLIK